MAERDQRDAYGGGGDAGQRGQQHRPAPQGLWLGDPLRAQGRKVGSEPFGVDLEQPLGTVDVLEAVEAEITEADAPNLVVRELAGRAGEQHLAAARDRSDARGAVHAEAQVGLVADGRLTRVQAHADPDLGAVGPLVRCQGTLCCDGRRQRRAGTSEHEEEGVTLAGDLVSPAGLHGRPEDAVMLREQVAVSVSEPRQQTCRTFDVREQEGDGSLRELGHQTALSV